jgi:hypothetical protein
MSDKVFRIISEDGEVSTRVKDGTPRVALTGLSIRRMFANAKVSMSQDRSPEGVWLRTWTRRPNRIQVADVVWRDATPEDLS